MTEREETERCWEDPVGGGAEEGESQRGRETERGGGELQRVRNRQRGRKRETDRVGWGWGRTSHRSWAAGL